MYIVSQEIKKSYEKSSLVNKILNHSILSVEGLVTIPESGIIK